MKRAEIIWDKKSGLFYKFFCPHRIYRKLCCARYTSYELLSDVSCLCMDWLQSVNSAVFHIHDKTGPGSMSEPLFLLIRHQIFPGSREACRQVRLFRRGLESLFHELRPYIFC